MIDIRIQPGKRTNYEFTPVTDVRISFKSNAKNLILRSLLENPINTHFLSNQANLSIVVQITIGGQDYSSYGPWVSIDYDFYLSNASSPIILEFHLVRFMGDLDGYPFACPSSTQVLSRRINWNNLQNILYHEFGHLLDALNPNFHYDKNTKNDLNAETKHIFFQLWNVYIDRRLRNALGGRYAILSLEGPTKFVTSICASNSDYTFTELIQMANSCVEQ